MARRLTPDTEVIWNLRSGMRGRDLNPSSQVTYEKEQQHFDLKENSCDQVT